MFEDAKTRAVKTFQTGSAKKRKKRQAESPKRKTWTSDEITRLAEGIQVSGTDWTKISDHVKTRTPAQCKSKNQKMEISDGTDWFKKKLF